MNVAAFPELNGGTSGGGLGDIEGRLRTALGLLIQARDYAEELGRSPWDFAVESHSLRSIGLTTNDLRWLVYKGYVEHAHDVTQLDDKCRTFRASPVGICPMSCFVLTDLGMHSLASSLGMTLKSTPLRPEVVLTNSISQVAREEKSLAVPKWDGKRRELRLGKDLVKQFRLPSPNQEQILNAFEEETWPARIDDPLPHIPEVEPKQRLRETIRSLNRNQRKRHLRFRGDGTGEGVLWELVPHHEATGSAADKISRSLVVATPSISPTDLVGREL